jgi:ParB-like chromosome segregation protein Spo0J
MPVLLGVVRTRESAGPEVQQQIMPVPAQRLVAGAPVKRLGLEEIPIDELVPFPGNARRGNVPKIMESLRRHGQHKPLIGWQREGKPVQVICGNHTLQALAALKQPTALVLLVECDDQDEAARINVSDNATGDNATWDAILLGDQLEGFGGDFEGLGFSAADLSKYMYDGASRDERDVPEDPPSWQTLLDHGDEQNQAEWLEWWASDHSGPPPAVTGEARPLIRS